MDCLSEEKFRTSLSTSSLNPQTLKTTKDSQRISFWSMRFVTKPVSSRVFNVMFQFSELRHKMLKTQLSVASSVRERDYLASCLEHLTQIKSQLEEREETSVLVRLQLLNDPARFLVSRLLDPHLLPYKWPFGGLLFTFSILSSEELQGEGEEDEVKSDHIFLDNAGLVGAGWDRGRQCLSKDVSNRALGKIRGVPTDKKVFAQPPDTIQVPVFSSRHRGELLQVPLAIGDQNKEFWQRRNIYVRIE